MRRRKDFMFKLMPRLHYTVGVGPGHTFPSAKPRIRFVSYHPSGLLLPSVLIVNYNLQRKHKQLKDMFKKKKTNSLTSVELLIW